MTVKKLRKIDPPYVPSPFESNQKTKLIKAIEFNLSIKSTQLFRKEGMRSIKQILSENIIQIHILTTKSEITKIYY